MAIKKNVIINGDCLDYLDKIPIPHLIITDPPYEFESSGWGIVGMRVTFDRIKKSKLDKFNFYDYIPKGTTKIEKTKKHLLERHLKKNKRY